MRMHSNIYSLTHREPTVVAVVARKRPNIMISAQNIFIQCKLIGNEREIFRFQLSRLHFYRFELPIPKVHYNHIAIIVYVGSVT